MVAAQEVLRNHGGSVVAAIGALGGGRQGGEGVHQAHANDYARGHRFVDMLKRMPYGQLILSGLLNGLIGVQQCSL